MKPFFTYFGGKWRVAGRYAPPAYDRIVEPFAGAAGYSVRYAGREVILIERDPAVAATWRYLMGASGSEIRALPDIGMEQSVDELHVCEEARLLIGWWLNKGTASPCKRPSSWMRSGIRPQSYWGAAIRERIAHQIPRIEHWQLIEGDYTDAPDIEACWFIDPPYQGAGHNYRAGSKDLDYEQLGQWCRERKGQVQVCENVGASWLPFESWFSIKGTPGARGGGRSAEALWTQGCGDMKQTEMPF